MADAVTVELTDLVVPPVRLAPAEFDVPIDSDTVLPEVQTTVVNYVDGALVSQQGVVTSVTFGKTRDVLPWGAGEQGAVLDYFDTPAAAGSAPDYFERLTVIPGSGTGEATLSYSRIAGFLWFTPGRVLLASADGAITYDDYFTPAQPINPPDYFSAALPLPVNGEAWNDGSYWDDGTGWVN